MLKYEIETKKFSELKDKIIIPRFQRGLVWSKTKKIEFIKTLKAGLPIGVLMLSKKDDKYQIIDGLQRFSTMKDYSKNYFEYIDKSEITDIDLTSIILMSPDARTVFDNYRQADKDREFEVMRGIIAENLSAGHGQNLFQISAATTSELCKKIAAIPDKDYGSIQGAVYSIIEHISNQAKIDDITIPLIIFKGNEDELADIFQKLNTEGVRLTKYDVFAATWIDHSVTVKDDPKFIDFIINKYDKAQENTDLEIASYDPEKMKQTGELTVFEYAFAVGKALMDKCKRLFPKSDDPKNDAKVDSIGFLILAELLGLTYQNMGKLAETITQYINLDYKKLKDAILECGGIVESALGSHIDSPTIPKKGKKASLVCHSELQLVSFIIVVFRLKYEVSLSDGLKARPKHKELSKVKQYLPKHYLYDILRDYWSGSGDSKLEDIISDAETCRYTKDVDRAEFEMTVSTWFNEQNKKSGLTKTSAETKLFLNYLLRYSGVYSDMISYDIEHCVPKDTLKKYYIGKGKTVPISPACNLVYIPTSDNRSKGEETYYQRQARDPGTFKLNQNQLDAFGYPSRQELRFAESTAGLTEDNYFSYLENRKAVILNKFIGSLYD